MGDCRSPHFFLYSFRDFVVFNAGNLETRLLPFFSLWLCCDAMFGQNAINFIFEVFTVDIGSIRKLQF